MKATFYPFLCTFLLLVQVFLVIGKLSNNVAELNEKRTSNLINSNDLFDDYLRVGYPQPNQMYPHLIQELISSNRDKDYWHPFYINDVGGDDSSDSMIIKRQVKYRQCYFNPVSCFRK